MTTLIEGMTIIMKKQTRNFIRIGAGAGYAGDRIEPAVELIKNADLDYICFECLAERTIALANKRKLNNLSCGYDDFLIYRMENVLGLCAEKGVKLISNMGAANPEMAANIVRDMAKNLGLNLKVAAVIGDDIYHEIKNYMDYDLLERDLKVKDISSGIVSANVYMDSKGIVKALEEGADIVITGRVSDPALYLGPLIYEYGWSREDKDILGKGTLVGHMLECSSQVCGGYFAEPGYKEVDNLESLGFPYADVSRDGNFIVGKLRNSGGNVTTKTCKEQILYEVQDPSNYLTPDCTADFSKVALSEIEKDRVAVKGASGRNGSGLLKVSIGYRDGFLGEGQISYGGTGCLKRAKLALNIIKKRLNDRGILEFEIDIIGYNSLYKSVSLSEEQENALPEVRLRVAARCKSEIQAKFIGDEVEALYLNGPAGGGGAEKTVKEIIAIASIFIPEKDVAYKVINKV